MADKVVSNRSTPPISLATSEQFVIRSPLTDGIRRFRRNKLAMVGLAIMLAMLLVAVFADVITPYPYDRVYLNLPASTLPFVNPDHALGLDTSSRDYLARLIYGARTSMLVGLTVPLIAFGIGVPLGAASGYLGGKVDFVLQRVIEVVTAIPPLLFALFLLSVVGSGLGNVIFILSVTSWIESARLTRAQFLTFREKEFVTSARAIGATDWQIITSHILPNALSPLLISFTFAVPLAIFAEASLSFLGIGITEPTASWGKMISSGVGNTIRVYYHLALFPTLLVMLTMLSFSFVGDGLQEALDPSRSQ